jgi:putative FmdB family regulatory protein
MPLYEYKCRTCDQVFEVIQKFSDEPLKTHDGCGGELERLMGSPVLQFKGSGWYITDYKKSGGGGKSSSDTKPAEGKKSEAKSESASTSSTPAPSTPAKS